MLQRIGAGIFLSIVSMIVSAIVEDHRRSLALTKPLPGIRTRGDVSSMSGFWLIPQLAIAGLAEAFTAIGLVEFYYKRFPENIVRIVDPIPPSIRITSPDQSKKALVESYLVMDYYAYWE